MIKINATRTWQYMVIYACKYKLGDGDPATENVIQYIRSHYRKMDCDVLVVLKSSIDNALKESPNMKLAAQWKRVGETLHERIRYMRKGNE